MLQIFIFSSSFFAQNYPAYIATVYDTAASEGYYFFSPKLVFSLGGQIKETQMILDKNGKVVYFHDFPAGINASDFKIQKNGLMTYIGPTQFYIMDSTFTIIDSVHHKNGVKYDQHDFQILPNDHYLYLGAENITMDLSSYQYFHNGTLYGSSNATVRCGIIQEQDASKNVVFEWHAKDHFQFSDVDQNWLYDTANVDWNHFNAVDLDTDGNILLSIRYFNEITKINRTDSSIIWRLGGKQNEFTYTNDTNRFIGQHDIRRIANGNLTLFDNGRLPHPASAREYSLDENLKTATLVWSYVLDSAFESQSRGGVQRISNGNTIVDYGRMDGQNMIFNFVDQSGNSIFEVRSPDTLVSYRAYNYPVLPWDLNQPKIICEELNGQLYLSVDSGLAGYYWNTGDTTFKIAVSTTDTFFVFVARGSGGFIRSKDFIVSCLVNPCSLTPVSESSFTADTFVFKPNPVTDHLIIEYKAAGKPINITSINLISIFGNTIYFEQPSKTEDYFRTEINVKPFSSGIYILKVTSDAGVCQRKIIIAN